MKNRKQTTVYKDFESLRHALRAGDSDNAKEQAGSYILQKRKRQGRRYCGGSRQQ